MTPIDEKLSQRFKCAKCNQRGAIVKRFAATGTGISRFLDWQHNRYIAVSCKRCGFTELYDPEIIDAGGRAMDVLDLLWGN